VILSTQREMSPAQALAFIVEEWLAYGVEHFTPGAICWLDLTPVGEEYAQRALRRGAAMTTEAVFHRGSTDRCLMPGVKTTGAGAPKTSEGDDPWA
jgi:hypothetical protein